MSGSLENGKIFPHKALTAGSQIVPSPPEWRPSRAYNFYHKAYRLLRNMIKTYTIQNRPSFFPNLRN